MKTHIFLILLVLQSSIISAQNAFKSEVSGSGQSIMFLPGFTCPGEIWKPTLRRLENHTGSFESHLITYAGFNKITPIDTPWYQSIRDELIVYIGEHPSNNWMLIGHSMGGNLAIDIAAKLPQKINKVILAESIPCMREIIMPGVPKEAIQYQSTYNQQTLNMDTEDLRKMAEMMAANMTMKEDRVKELINWTMESDRKTYVYGYTDLMRLDQRPLLEFIEADVLILGAPFPDASLVRSNYEKQYENLDRKQIQIAKDSKHFLMWDQEAWFYEKLTSFLRADAD
ncbi:MAG: alpha/beta hydrolase [Bacteroidota bacterium]